jgi:hypothetical protein
VQAVTTPAAVVPVASASRLRQARRTVTRLAGELPGRQPHLTAGSVSAGQELKQLRTA